MPVTVKVITDGPLMVKGECEMQDGQGNALAGKGGDTIFSAAAAARPTSRTATATTRRSRSKADAVAPHPPLPSGERPGEGPRYPRPSLTAIAKAATPTSAMKIGVCVSPSTPQISGPRKIAPSTPTR